MTHYLQSITPALALGGELVYHHRPGEEGAVMSFVGRYTGEAQFKVQIVEIESPGTCTSSVTCVFRLSEAAFSCFDFFCTGRNYVATLTVGSAGAHASYYHKANDQVTSLSFPLPSR